MIISMPDLADGHYQAELVVYAAEGREGVAVVAAAATHFWVDEGGGCLTADFLPAPHPPLPPAVSTPGHPVPGPERAREAASQRRGGAKAWRRGGALLNLAEGQPACLSSR